MKRLIVLMCILSLISGCITPTVAFADGLNIPVNEPFDNIATNGSPENVIVRAGLDARVVERSGTDKALYVKADGNAVKINVPLANVYSKTVFSFDIKVSGDPVKGGALSLSAGTGINVLNFLPDRRVVLDDGMDIGGYGNGVWTSYVVMIDFDNKLYDLYVNGKCKFTKRYFYSNLSKPTSININLACVNDGDVSEICLDNLAL